MCTSHKISSIHVKILSLLAAAGLLVLNAVPLMAQPSGDRAINDGQIVTILNAINENEIKLGQVAEQKATTEKVRNYAEMMVQSHQDNMDKASTLLVNTSPLDESSLIADQERKKGERIVSQLSSTASEEFDHAYISSMIKAHTETLAMIESQMLRTAKNQELRDHLNQTHDDVNHHLEEAKRIQAGM